MSLLNSGEVYISDYFILSLLSLIIYLFIESPSWFHFSYSSLKRIIFSMHKILVRYDLDHDVHWSIPYVGGMKIFWVFCSNFIHSKISKSFWKHENFEILQNWFESFSFTLHFLSWSNWTELKPRHLIRIIFCTWSESFSWWQILFDLIRIKICRWFESVSF